MPPNSLPLWLEHWLKPPSEELLQRVTHSSLLPQARVLGIHPLWVGLEGVRLLWEVGQLRKQMQDLKGLPTGQGEPIILVPAMPWLELACAGLASFLKQIGYCVFSLEMTRLFFSLEQVMEHLTRKVGEIAAHEGPVTLIGHSLGGILARDLAQLHPAWIRQVITLGTPHPRLQDWRPRPDLSHWPSEALSYFEQIQQRALNPLPVPALAIWSQSDGFVAPKHILCLPGERLQEVQSSHLGMVANWDVFCLLAHHLAQSLHPLVLHQAQEALA